MSPDQRFAVVAGVSGIFAVGIGAFGAHALAGRLTPDLTAIFETAARYHMYHTLGLLGVAWALSRWPNGSALPWAGWLFIAGTTIFSGSLYALALTGARWLGAVTPVGGVCLLTGWASFAWGVGRATSHTGGRHS